MDEPALIHDAQRGDLDAFNRLVLAYQDYLYNAALRILSDDAQAADATQDAVDSVGDWVERKSRRIRRIGH